LKKEAQELVAIVKLHKEELKTNRNAKPRVLKRTIGLQVDKFGPKEVNSIFQFLAKVFYKVYFGFINNLNPFI